jgi:hypothetical protein
MYFEEKQILNNIFIVEKTSRIEMLFIDFN